MTIKHTEAFDLAYRFVTETNLNIFLTGKAGTGKTTFLKYLRENSLKKMVVAAPTGVAAINAGGVTLHSLFQLPFAPFIPSKDVNNGANNTTVNSHSLLSQTRLNREKLNLLRNLELLVIDEASMVASHMVDAIDTILKSVRRRHQLPFGGVQVLFIGDLHQLPPVVKYQEWELLRNYYSSIFFFDSIILKENIPVMVELKEIFRQKDLAFIDILNGIRNNNLSIENFNLLNSRLKPNFIPLDEEGFITLTTHNNQSQEINKRKLQKLHTQSQIYQADIQGDFPEHLYPAEKQLELKKGAQVMFLKNDVEGKKYFNGKIGTITGLGEDLIKVKCKGEEQEIWVSQHEWKNVNYSLNPDTREITEKHLGGFWQFPLRLAWAITIHKSQGLTFDKLVVDAENAFANGQVYVALSRCTSLEGLVLTSRVNQKFLGAHQKLKDWQEKNQDEKVLDEKFHSSRQTYILQELQNIFIWKDWFFELQGLYEILKEHKENLASACFSWMEELTVTQKTLQEVADKFKLHIEELYLQNPIIEENQLLQKRIKDAANYFSAEILKWKEKFFEHRFTTDTKKIARQMDASLNEINITIHEILHKINHCKNGFLLNDYLKIGKKLDGTEEKIHSSYAQNQTKNLNEKEIEHSELYNRIAEMRNRLGRNNDLPLYTIFSNATIKNVCIGLPGNKQALKKISGFGKVKVQMFGDEVIALVQQYCLEKNITPFEILKVDSPGVKNSSTVQTTLSFFKNGLKIEEIAKERNLVVGTIESHISEAIKGDLVGIEEVMTMEEVNKISKYFTLNGDIIHLSEIKSKIPESENVTYGKLKMVLAWWLKEKKNE